MISRHRHRQHNRFARGRGARHSPSASGSSPAQPTVDELLSPGPTRIAAMTPKVPHDPTASSSCANTRGTVTRASSVDRLGRDQMDDRRVVAGRLPDSSSPDAQADGAATTAFMPRWPMADARRSAVASSAARRRVSSFVSTMQQIIPASSTASHHAERAFQLALALDHRCLRLLLSRTRRKPCAGSW